MIVINTIPGGSQDPDDDDRDPFVGVQGRLEKAGHQRDLQEFWALGVGI